MAWPAEGEVAHLGGGDGDVAEYLRLRTEDGNAPLLRLRPMKVGDPEVAGRIEYAAVAAGTAQGEENDRPAQRLAARRQIVTQHLGRLRLDDVEVTIVRID